MTRPIFAMLLLVGLLALESRAFAELCTIDAVPAATLLVPYFEVDLANSQGITTLFSVNNASAAATVVHVVFWTDWSAPTIDFDIYLTGYDVQTVNVRDVFAGNLPYTASVGQDGPPFLQGTVGPGGAAVGTGISPNSNIGIPGTDVNFASCTGLLPYTNPIVQGTALSRLVNGHQGLPVPSLANRCLGFNHGDAVARGYITLDDVSACSLVLDPGFPGYFVDGGVGIATNDNQLWGDYFFINEGQDFAPGEPLVHIEANDLLNGVNVPLLNPDSGAVVANVPNATSYTFYARYTAPVGSDNREALGTTWAVRYILGGGFNGGTDLIVWRDSTSDDLLPAGAICGVGPSWFPLDQTEIAAFDETEQVEELCTFVGGVISPPDDIEPACFPFETGRYPMGDEQHPFVTPNPLNPTPAFGWLYLNLSNLLYMPGQFGSDGTIVQSYVSAHYNADGHFSVGLQANELTDACQDLNIRILP